LAGAVAKHAGYAISFITLSVIAATALVLFGMAMAETRSAENAETVAAGR
jgi:hypothetical protein